MSWKLMLTLFSPFSSFLQQYSYFLNFTYKWKHIVYDVKVYRNLNRAAFWEEQRAVRQ